MRLIDADALAAKIMMEAPDFMDGGSSITKAFILAMVKTRSIAPTVDAVPVVRCRDCKHKETCKITPLDTRFRDEWFCADGKRRQKGENNDTNNVLRESE